MKKDKKKLPKYYLIILLIIVIIGIFIVWLVRPTTKRLEAKMENLVREYYEKEIKGNVIGIGKQLVTLKALSDSGYDIRSFKNCSEESYSYVLIENPTETDKTKIKYSIENHLDCN